MGIFAEYLDGGFGTDAAKLSAERKKQLARICDIRKNDVLVYAVDVTKGKSPITINYSDLLPLTDQIANLKGERLDLILETPGGSGETSEDIVKLLRGRFSFLGVIVAGMAKSTGTLLAMAADEILMEPMSALGPIDAQITWQGKQFSAHALLEGMEKIKEEVIATGSLNRAYVPILQNISPGELQGAQNALDFASDLVTEWLAKYKFKDWATHSSTGKPVTDADRRQRANEIAARLRNHSNWKTHGRSIKVDDLRAMRLKITDYTDNPELADAIRRYYTLLQMTFQSNVYKVFETSTSQIMRLEAAQAEHIAPATFPQGALAGAVEAKVKCKKCGATATLQARFDPAVPKKAGVPQFPDSNLIPCPGNCGTSHNLTAMRQQMQAQFGRPIVGEKA